MFDGSLRSRLLVDVAYIHDHRLEEVIFSCTDVGIVFRSQNIGSANVPYVRSRRGNDGRNLQAI